MTLEVEVPRVSYTADGETATFATAFTFELATEVTVWRGEPYVEDCCAVPEYDNLYALNVDYTIDAGNWLSDGGVIRFAAHALPAEGQVVTLMRTTPPDQPESFGDQDEFQPEQHEFTIDRLTRMVQELYHNPLGFMILGGLAYDVMVYTAVDGWDDQTPLLVVDFARGVSFPGGFLASPFSVEAYDSAPVVVSIQKFAAPGAEGVEVGTLTIPADGGDVVLATEDADGVSFTLGEQLKLIPPEGGMGAVRGLAGTFAGVISG